MTDESQHNVAILKEAYGAWNEKKEQAFDIWMDLMTDDVCLKSLADGAPGMEFTSCCHNKQEVLEYLQTLAKEWEMVEYNVEEYIAQGDKVVAVVQCAWRYRKTGKTAHTPKVDIVTLREGKVCRFVEFYDTAKVLACLED